MTKYVFGDDGHGVFLGSMNDTLVDATPPPIIVQTAPPNQEMIDLLDDSSGDEMVSVGKAHVETIDISDDSSDDETASVVMTSEVTIPHVYHKELYFHVLKDKKNHELSRGKTVTHKKLFRTQFAEAANIFVQTTVAIRLCFTCSRVLTVFPTAKYL
jgi:hypothetical protein